MLNSAFRHRFSFDDFTTSFSGAHQIEIPVGAGDVAQQRSVDVRRIIADDELCLHPAFAVLKRGCERQKILDDASS